MLLPLYTVYLRPADYGIIALCAMISAVLGILFPMSLHGALTRFYFSGRDDVDRRERTGTIWFVMIASGAMMALVLDRIGAEVFGAMLRKIPFSPYVRLTIWTSFFNSFGLVPLNIFQIEKRPGAYVLTVLANTILTITFVIHFVVFQKAGAYGYLLGLFLASAIFVVPYTILTLRVARVVPRWDVVGASLAYSLPLVPHAVGGWLLELSDRAILEKYVPLEQVGLYSIGYQFASILTMVATAINSAWVPYLFESHTQGGDAAKPNLARLATYYVFTVSWAALGVVSLGTPGLGLLTPPAFHDASQVIPWIVAGLLFNALYLLPANILFLMSKTKWIPLATVSGGGVNVVMNLWLVPQYGILAAAWATFAGYGAMALVTWIAAQRAYRLPYEYKRLGLVSLVVVTLFVLAASLPSSPTLADIALRGAVWLIFPFVLAFVGVVTPSEGEAALSVSWRLVSLVRWR